MKTIKLKNLDINVGKGKAFAYNTPDDLPKAHQNCLFVGKRASGKTLGCVNLLEKMNYQRIFVVSPSVSSNKDMMDRLHLDPDDIYDDVDDITCIDQIIVKLDQERDDLESYQEKMKQWKLLSHKLRNGVDLGGDDDDAMINLYNPLTREFEKPEHRWGGKSPMCAILFDDVVGSMLFTKGIRKLNKMTIYHRHISPFSYGGAVGVSLFFLIQTYKATSGGISKCIRNNTTSMALFKTKNDKELKDIQEELGGEVDRETFYKMYEYATAEPHSFLFIDLHPKKPEYAFRKRWDELLVPENINQA